MTVFNKCKKTVTIFRCTNDKLPETQAPRVYEILCSCGKSRIRQTGRVIEVRINKRKQTRYIIHNRIDKSEHVHRNKEYDIDFNRGNVLNEEIIRKQID